MTGSRTEAKIGGQSVGRCGRTMSIWCLQEVRTTTKARRRESTLEPGAMTPAKVLNICFEMSKEGEWSKRYLPTARIQLSEMKFWKVGQYMETKMNLI